MDNTDGKIIPEDSTEEVINTESRETEDTTPIEQEEVEVDQEIENLKMEINELEDRYLRIQAEMANMRKRNQKDREEAARYKAQSLATNMLPVKDNLERALTIPVESEQGLNLKKGIEMVLSSFEQAFQQEGIVEINPVNEKFDPQYHEAYTTVPANDGQESGIVAQVFEKGYALNGRVLRAAKVVVTQ
ncbi:nucleotide exchange factor GrpE [Lacticigenium naphthae]|uniref:nucleotide exchange factor GrpE n=1 Tax=Lacticigenium naphthae TaxID=515351 RepID=UPI00040482AA|nr:nucleotide exchange factor GrpE [Lacticigenium naphthae]